MKIAIKANPDRGKEIISLLKSLGGINSKDWKGDGNLDTYYIDKDNKIQYDRAPKDYKVYTLEEFEKEFPFKIGDLCIYQSEYAGDIVVKVLRMIIQDNDIVYEIGHKDTDKTYSGIYRKRETLKPYKEMKEERNIKLTLDKAKEWYKKGGELKEIALQAFTEKELTKVDLPKSWEEFCENCPIKKGESYIDDFSDTECFITGGTNRNSVQDKNVCPSNKSAEAHLAMIQLEQLRDCYRQGDIPDFTKETTKYCIVKINKRIDIVESFYTSFFLSFTKKEVAEEYLKNFKPLIEQAGDLI